VPGRALCRALYLDVRFETRRVHEAKDPVDRHLLKTSGQEELKVWRRHGATANGRPRLLASPGGTTPISLRFQSAEFSHHTVFSAGAGSIAGVSANRALAPRSAPLSCLRDPLQFNGDSQFVDAVFGDANG